MLLIADKLDVNGSLAVGRDLDILNVPQPHPLTVVDAVLLGEVLSASCALAALV